MSFEHPIEALMNEVSAAMVAEGMTVEHILGAKLEQHGAPPRYVWIPTDIRDRSDSPTREVDEYRTLFVQNALVEVHCWGSSYAQAWALLTNLCKACNDAVKADLEIEQARHINPSKSQNQNGEVIAITLSVKVPLIDAYVDIETLADPEPETVLPIDIVGDIQTTDDLEDDGESLVTVSTTP